MGQKDSGKSTLLHLLGGPKIAAEEGVVGGVVTHDGRDARGAHTHTHTHTRTHTAGTGTRTHTHRVGYVCATDEHFDTLTVGDTVG
jgi:ABC-type multidrug transport system ATPase subunit